MKKFLTILCLLGLFYTPLIAQIPEQAAVAAISISALSDAQFEAYLQKAQLTGLSEAELEAKAKERGLTDMQIAEIKARMSSKGGTNPKSIAPNIEPRRAIMAEAPAAKTAAAKDANGLSLFGEEFFTNTNLSFEPNLRIATPGNYVLGPEDELNLDIFGYSERITKLKINTEGQVRLPNLGPITLAGLTIDEAKARLKDKLSKVYPGLKTGQTNLQLGLGQIRSIRVILIGEIKKPGTYSLSSLSTIANALYASGGPSANGSFRKISLIRGGKTIVVFDFYDFLLQGNLSKNLLLKDDDVIKVSPYQVRVSVNGAVKRPAIYECIEGDCLKDLVNDYAGGFSDDANKSKISLVRIGDSSRQLLDIGFTQLGTTRLKSADMVNVGRILDKFDNRVAIGGAVYFPGYYSLEKSPDLKSLLRLGQLTENAFLNRAILYRVNAVGEQEIKAVDLHAYLPNVANAQNNPLDLQNKDSLFVYARQNLSEGFTVSITGQVNQPGSFAYRKGMVLEDLVLLAGGLTDRGSAQEVSLMRRMRKDKTLADTVVYSTVYKLDLTDSLALIKGRNPIALEPYDVLQVKQLPRNRTAGSVVIRGQALFPGTYDIQTKKDRISDLVQRAGGLVPSAYPTGAYMLRKTFSTETGADLIAIKRNVAKNQIADSLALVRLGKSIDSSRQMVAFDLTQALANPGSSADVFLEDGDVLDIPKTPTTVSIFGAVHFEKKKTFEPGLNAKDMVKEAGGFNEKANKKGLYVLYPNGSIKKSHSSFIFFRSYPRLQPGAEVFVPENKEKKQLNTAEIVALSSAILGISTLIITTINLVK